MPDNKFDIEITQGSTFELNLTIKNSNGSLKSLTGCSSQMQIRPRYSSNTITESLSTANGEININTATSSIHLMLPANRTANIKVDMNTGNPPKTKYVYDLELIDPETKVSKLLYGEVIVYGEVTR